MAAVFYQILLVAALLGVIFAKPIDETNDTDGSGLYAASHGKQILLTLREACMNRSGSEEGFHQFLVALPPAMRCLRQYIDLPQMMIDLKTMTQDNRKEVSETYCPKFTESKVCFDDTIQAVATCLGQNTKATREILGEMLSGGVELMCKDDGNIFFEARKPAFRSCIKDVKQHVKDCKSTKIPKTTPLTEYGKEECLELVKARDCLQEKVNACDSLAIMDIVDIYYNPIFKANNCLKIPASATDDQGAVDNSWNDV